MVIFFVALGLFWLAAWILVDQKADSWATSAGAGLPGTDLYVQQVCNGYLANGTWDCFWLPIIIISLVAFLAISGGSFGSAQKRMEESIERTGIGGRMMMILSSLGWLAWSSWIAIQPYINCYGWFK